MYNFSNFSAIFTFTATKPSFLVILVSSIYGKISKTKKKATRKKVTRKKATRKKATRKKTI